MNALSTSTPLYVLLDDKLRIGPSLTASQSGPQYTAIYSFSDKQPYDLFCANCDLPLTPYPLVRGYLKNQIADAGEAVHFVVVDAAGPREGKLNATTMGSVLEAQEQKANHVNISFQLMQDPGSQAYRVEKASCDLDVTGRPAETQRT